MWQDVLVWIIGVAVAAMVIKGIMKPKCSCGDCKITECDKRKK